MKKHILSICYVAFVAFLIIGADIAYTHLFENLPLLRDAVYLQNLEHSLHRRSNVDELFYELRPNAQSGHNRINAIGMKNKEVSKTTDNYRVLVMGDSVTFGPEVPNEQTFTQCAEDILCEHGEKIEILNAGVCGYNTRQEFVALKEKYLSLEPDMVIFAYCVNDLGNAFIQNMPDEYPQKIIRKKIIQGPDAHFDNLTEPEYLALTLPNQFFLPDACHRFMLIHSSMYRFLALRTFAKKKHLDYRNIQFELMGYNIDETLYDIAHLATERGFLVQFLILPTPPRFKYKLTVPLTKLTEHTIPYWDFNTRITTTKGFWTEPRSLHFSPEGHAAVGIVLAEYILSTMKNKETTRL